MQSASLQLAEWRDWREVVDEFAPLYEDETPLPADVEQEVKRDRGERRRRLRGARAAVLRFMQSAVRYLAISMGEGGYTPRAATSEIGATRYGDCKDKSKLFARSRAGWARGGPALVNTRDGYTLDSALPTGEMFDHCIVRLDIDGKVYWLDPTYTPQQSPLSVIEPMLFRLGFSAEARRGRAGAHGRPPPVTHRAKQLETRNSRRNRRARRALRVAAQIPPRPR